MCDCCGGGSEKHENHNSTLMSASKDKEGGANWTGVLFGITIIILVLLTITFFLK